MRFHLALRWIVFATVAAIMNFPVIATFVTALKSPSEISRNPSLIIERPTFENFMTVLTISDRLNVYHYLWNSFSAAMIGAILPMLVAFPMAWAMVRRGCGHALLFPLVVNLRALPLVIFAVPLYLMFSAAHLLDTRIGLGLVLAVVNLPLALMLLVNAVSEVPIELEEAARMDGAGLPRLIGRGCAAALSSCLHYNVRVRIHHCVERIPLWSDPDNPASGAGNGRGVVLLRDIRRRGSVGSGRRCDGCGCSSATALGPVHVP